MLLYNIKTHPFFLKRDFRNDSYMMSFKNFGKRKKRKNPVVSHLACTTGFFRLLFKFIISSPRFYFSFFTAFMMISK